MVVNNYENFKSLIKPLFISSNILPYKQRITKCSICNSIRGVNNYVIVDVSNRSQGRFLGGPIVLQAETNKIKMFRKIK
jgi:hypothetical protein